MKIVAVRVPEETEKKMKEINEDWSAYLRRTIDDRLQKEEQKRLLKKLERVFKKVPKSPRGFGARSVREDRDRG